MKKKILMSIVAAGTLLGLNACENDLLARERGGIKVEIEQGPHWLHEFTAFMGIKQKNAPQMAVWAEDMSGNYLSTLFVTKRTTTQSWRGNPGLTRPESLPAWTFAVNGASIDGFSGATPRESFDVKIRPNGALRRFVVKVEVNHSTDWNESWPESAGGENGQPAVVYAAAIDLDSEQKEFSATLVGHSSADGSNGDITTDTSTLTTALDICKSITVKIED